MLDSTLASAGTVTLHSKQQSAGTALGTTPAIVWTRERGVLCAECRNISKYIRRDVTIEGLRLVVLDDVVGEADAVRVFDGLRALRYRLNDVDGPESHYIYHWKHDLPTHLPWSHPGMQPHGRLIEALWLLAASVAGSERILGRLRRAHVNMILYGDSLNPHNDLADGWTLLYYANPDSTWDPRKCQGETIYYTSQDDALHAVAPRQGRIVIFEGNIRHRAGAPGRECFEPRITLALKFK